MIVLGGIVPVFMIVALGVLARRAGWIDERFVAQLNHVVYLLAIPALLVHLIGHSDLGQSLSGSLIGVCAAVTAVVGGAVWLVSGWRGTSQERRGVIVQASIRGNLAYVGFPVVLAVGGEEALRLAAVTAAVLIPFQNLISITALAAGRRTSLLGFVRALVLNPVVLGVAGGVLWSLSGWSGWVWLDSFLEILGHLALPGALIALGGQIRLDALRSDLRAAAFSTVTKVVVVPGLCLAALAHLGATPMVATVGVLLLAAPTAVVSAAIAQGMGGDPELAGAAVVLASLASFPAYVVWGLVL